MTGGYDEKGNFRGTPSSWQKDHDMFGREIKKNSSTDYNSGGGGGGCMIILIGIISGIIYLFV